MALRNPCFASQSVFRKVSRFDNREVGIISDRVIGNGRTAELLARPDGRCVKLYCSGMGAAAGREYALLRALAGTPLPVPAVFARITQGGRPGFEMEYVAGESLLALLMRNPMAIRKVAHRMAALHAQVHQTPPPGGLAPLAARLRRDIPRAEGLSEATRQRVLDRLDALPGGQALCHFDLHPGNILRGADGRDVIIDWPDACAGNPCADVCRTVVLLLGASPPPGSAPRLAQSLRAFNESLQRQYLAEYCRLTGRNARDFAPWLAPVAAARLAERAGDPEALRKMVEMGLS